MGGRDDEFLIEELEELEIDATPAPAPTVEDRRRIAQQLAAKAQKKPSLADRVPKMRTAAEVMEEAFRAERQAAQQKVDEGIEAKRRAAAEALAKVEATRRAAEARAAADRDAALRAQADREAFDAMGAGPAAPRRPGTRPRHRVDPNRSAPMAQMLAEQKLLDLLGPLGVDVTVIEVYTDIPVAVVGPLWASHQARAIHAGQLADALAAQALREVLTHRPTDLMAAHVEMGGQAWAVWLDTDDERILAAMTPAAVYLVGL